MMNPLLVATTNSGKLKEFAGLLPEFQLQAPKDFPNVAIPDVLEDGKTFFENALKKALQFFEVYQMPCLADDSGLEIVALKGAPGVHSARYGGDCAWPERRLKVLEALEGVSDRRAAFVAVLCYYDGKKDPVFASGRCEGHIMLQSEGEQGFGYDPLFLAVDLEKTFGVATAAEKAQVSHRARAVQNLRARLSLLDQVAAGS